MAFFEWGSLNSDQFATLIADCEKIKSDLDMRPVYVRAPQRITAHFFICFIALLVLKIMQKQHRGAFPVGQIRQTLSAMNLTKLEGFGYIPAFNHTPFRMLRKYT